MTAATETAYKVAIVQAPPVLFDLERSVERATELIAKAGAGGARLVAFPEVWLPGFPMWIFGAAGWGDPAAKRAYANLVANAVSVNGEAMSRLCDAASEAGCYVVIGMHERDDSISDGTLFNAITTISDAGEVLGVHRKLVPTHAERILWAQGDGSTLGVVDTPLGRIGGLACWEHWMPLARHALHADGEQVHIAAWPETADDAILASRSYAFEGRCFVLAAFYHLTTDDIPEDFELRSVALGYQHGDDNTLMPGGSGLIGPDGEWIVGPVYGDHELVFGEIDLGRIQEEKMLLDVAGHSHRPDVFEFGVNRAAGRHLPELGRVRSAQPDVERITS